MALSYKKMAKKDLASMKVKELKQYISNMANRVTAGLRSGSKEIRERAKTLGAITGIRRRNRAFEIIKGTGKMTKAELIKRAELFQEYAYSMARIYGVRRGIKDVTLRPQSEKAFQTFNKRFNNEEDKLTRAEWDQMATVLGDLQDEFEDYGSEVYVIYDICQGKYSFETIGKTIKDTIRKTSNLGFDKRDVMSVVLEKLLNEGKTLDEAIDEQIDRKDSYERKKKGL